MIYNQGSIYALQEKLEEEPELPDLFMENNGTFTQIFTKSLPLRRTSQYNEESYNLFWTSDIEENIEKVYKTTEKMCNITQLHDKTEEEYTQNLYRYRCYNYKRVYYIPFSNYYDFMNIIIQNVSFNMNTPFFDIENPYIYYPDLLLFGKKYNFFNTFFSRHLLEYLKQLIITWFDNIHSLSFKSDQYFFISGNDIGQIYIKRHNVLPISSFQGFLISDISDIKIQLNIKDEYYFWALEKIKNNCDILCSLGIDQFKYMTNFGEIKIFKYEELYPNYKDKNGIDFIDNNFEEYYFKDNIYKRELLNPPNIVFYLKESIIKYTHHGALSSLLNKLVEMFPDHLPISNGVSRFNIRFSKNVCFSIGGNNESKFDKELVNDKSIPLEYQTIINMSNDMELTTAQYDKLNEYSVNISGHHVLKYDQGRHIPNNILSYRNLLTVEYKSFEELFQDKLLFNYQLVKFIPLKEFLINNISIFPMSIINKYCPDLQKNGGKKYKKSIKNSNKNIKKILSKKNLSK
jgi:hypothetical protein